MTAVRDRVPLMIRLDPADKRQLAVLLTRGGLTFQDFFGACARCALGKGGDDDPIAALDLIRNHVGDLGALGLRQISDLTKGESA